MMSRMAGFKFATVCCCFLALAACSKKNTPSLDGGRLDGGQQGGLSGGNLSPLERLQQDFATNVGDRIFFIVDQSNLTPEAQDTLGKQVAWLQSHPNVTVQVEGHSDERGTREYNIALSARRATAARGFLISHGVPGNRISSIAYGKERPASLCDAEECWSQNRRAVTVITGGAN
ncbi:MAG TPA: peptidoglycan-associated lipoprotein Pal [Aestuariivirga sp.]|jgi:peptidoglycan-associated lipoprotein|nr:peptidoglycan-associated lipoprotein Pal [Aestuariivirga sp.]